MGKAFEQFNLSKKQDHVKDYCQQSGWKYVNIFFILVSFLNAPDKDDPGIPVFKM